MLVYMRIFARCAALAGLLIGLVAFTGQAHAMKIQTVTSPGGITAWLVEEHTIPLIAMKFAFMGGASQDPSGKPGLSHFLTAMLDEGAGDLNSNAFQERLEEYAVKISFNSGRDTFTGNFQTLTENRDVAVDLLRMAITEPRFDIDAIERMRQQLAASLAFDRNNPEKVAAKAWFRTAFQDHPYARPVKGTRQSVAAIDRDDLIDYRKRIFARDNLKVAVVGDIDAATLGALLDKVFGGLGEKANLTAIPRVDLPESAEPEIIEMNVPQSVAQFGHSGLARDDDDFIAAFVLNYIIGGGGFSSRLMEEVREKRGLAYSVYSYLQPYEHSSIYVGGVATKNEGISKSLEVIRQVFSDMAANGPSEKRLEDAKRYLTGSYALRFDTSRKIAGQLLWIQIENLGLDYIDKRNEMIEAITLKDIRRVAKRLLRPDGFIVTIVGRPENMGKKS